jgi:diguanylate cyclase (GGDEF)-like protein
MPGFGAKRPPTSADFTEFGSLKSIFSTSLTWAADTVRMMPSTVRIAAGRIVGRLGLGMGHGRVLAVGSLMIAIVVAIAITIWDMRYIVIADALLNTENLAIVLAKQTSHSIQTVDIVLREIEERVTALGVATPEQFKQVLQSQEVHEFLRSRVERLPQVDTLALIGSDGARVNNSFDWPIPAGNFSDRDYTRYFVAHDDPGLFISEPVVSRTTGVQNLYLVHRINGPHGEFLGLVLGSLPLKVFASIYDSINLPRSESIVLLRRDGTVLVRNLDVGERAITKMPAASPWYALVAQGGGHYESPGVFDATSRMVSVRPLPDYPLVIDVGLTKETALAHWRREAILIALGTTATMGCILLMLHRLQLQFRRLEDSKSILTSRNADLTQAAAALQRSEAHLAATSHELEITLASMDQGLMMVDSEGRAAVCNRRAIEMFGLSEPLMASRPMLSAVQPLQFVAAELGLDPAGTHPAQVIALSRCRERVLPNGLIVEVGCVPLTGGSGWVVTYQDITARRRAEQQVVFMARHDALTRLPNRVMFRERLELAIAQTDRSIAAAVLFLDLDHFKAVNDTLGHPIGDGLLRTVADRLGFCVRQVDTIARFGGDEFAVIQVGPERVEDVAVLAQRISDVLSTPYEIDGHQVIVGVSIGIAMVPIDGSDPDTLLKNADIALYRAKAEGRGMFRMFEPAMDARLQERRTLELDLHRALATRQFELFYQPLVNAASQRISGFEALIRWNHPTRGLLNPDLFISTTEEMGLIVPLGRWALQEACREAATWPDDVKVAVNLSAVQFNTGDLVRVVTDALAESGLPARRLNLEITESVLLKNGQDILGILHKLRNLGVSISMDDFGTGYSSLSYLRSFPFDKIKIDQSFIRDLAHNEDAAVIVRAVTRLGSALGMATTAEGVETNDQFVRLQAEGCTEVQGFLFSKAAPAAEVPRLLRQFHSDEMPAA